MASHRRGIHIRSENQLTTALISRRCEFPNSVTLYVLRMWETMRNIDGAGD
jgi:hypothetical protein